eukprot:TRINITY_DN10436_c0_g1_i1.p1 TRINITY_DN10436_c0_g1~~TRINITY_DN10436_c0_g1_i1.p1  ORF type:complete len:376 (+),score=28.16 TRINITY_DN10436_c0_g1_i1:30-1157(+)
MCSQVSWTHVLGQTFATRPMLKRRNTLARSRGSRTLPKAMLLLRRSTRWIRRAGGGALNDERHHRRRRRRRSHGGVCDIVIRRRHRQRQLQRHLHHRHRAPPPPPPSQHQVQIQSGPKCPRKQNFLGTKLRIKLERVDDASDRDTYGLGKSDIIVQFGVNTGQGVILGQSSKKENCVSCTFSDQACYFPYQDELVISVFDKDAGRSYDLIGKGAFDMNEFVHYAHSYARKTYTVRNGRYHAKVTLQIQAIQAWTPGACVLSVDQRKQLYEIKTYPSHDRSANKKCAQFCGQTPLNDLVACQIFLYSRHTWYCTRYWWGPGMSRSNRIHGGARGHSGITNAQCWIMPLHDYGTDRGAAPIAPVPFAANLLNAVLSM